MLRWIRDEGGATPELTDMALSNQSVYICFIQLLDQSTELLAGNTTAVAVSLFM